jgi:hypothetical protein
VGTEPNNLVIAGYDVHERLGAGAMGEVFRATSRLTGEPVALKRLQAAPGGKPDHRRQLALMSEFQTSASLHHPHIVRVLDYGLDGTGRPYLAMELLENPQGLVAAGSGLPLADRVRLVLQLLQALVYLHRRGIVHRDIKPSNVLVQAGHVKLSDFGVATAAAATDNLAGTLGYMAPELLRGAAATPASDLYAVGLLTFELLHGRFPFEASTLRGVLRDVLGQAGSAAGPCGPSRTWTTLVEADALDGVDAPPLTEPPAVVQAAFQHGPYGPILRQLMCPDPRERYHDARRVIEDLGRVSGVPPAHDTMAVRESFLQAAPMVGRDRELGHLTEALKQAEEGHGGGWLVGGESGVGKSRLVDELRTVALVRGILVAQGQAVNEGSTPFHLWRAVLRVLVLYAPLPDEDASMLQLLVGDLPRLLRRPISAPPRLETHVAQARLFQCVEALLRRLPRPTLLVLEDLQWADPESFDLLRYLLRGAERSRLLLVATYRNDERPALPRDLPSMFNLKLGRLDPASVAALAEAMLGQAGARADVLELLQREAEGHVFFIIETARALAEAAGGFDAIDPDHLPRSVVTGGMAELMKRRLQAVGARDLELLKRAAVAGRRLDVALLQHLGGLDPADWLLRLANASVLDWHEGQWRFAHDKLREAVLAALEDTEVERLHAQVGDALEVLHADNLDPCAPALAHHAFWARRYELATAYSVRAGHVAERGHASAAARRHYMYGLAALELIADTPASRRLRADITAAYAECAWTAEAPDLMYSRLEAAHGLLAELAAPAGSEHAQADGHRLAELELWKGRVLHIGGQGGRAIEAYERTLALAVGLGDTDLQTVASVLIGQARMAQGYLRDWTRIAEGLDYLRQHATFVDVTRALGYVGLGMASEGRVSDGERSLAEAYALATAQNDDRTVAFAAVYYTLHYLTADAPEAALRYAQIVRQGARRSGDRILEFLGHGLQAWAEQRRGRSEQALSCLQAAAALRTELGGRVILDTWMAASECEILSGGDDLDAALRFSQALAERSTAGDAPLARGVAERCLAVLSARRQAAWEVVDAHLARSVQILDDAGARLEAARTERVGAGLANRAGRADEAVALQRAAEARYAAAGLPCPADP